MRLLLLANEPATTASVTEGMRPGSVMDQRPLTGLVGPDAILSSYGQSIVEDVGDDTVLLIEWVFDEAPAINVLTHRIREQRSGPCVVVVCTAEDRAAALAAGADAVLHLPFDASYLEAVVLAHRRLLHVTERSVRAQLGGAANAEPLLQLGPLVLDRVSLTLSVGEATTHVTPRESGLLAYLIKHAGQVCSREELLSNVWGIHFDTGTNMVDVYVFFVRRRLSLLGYPGGIKTVRGAGYRMDPPDERDSVVGP